LKKVKTTNPERKSLIYFLKKQSTENKVDIWRDIAERLATSRRKRKAVNISHLNRYTLPNEMVAVPAKVLGSGEIAHPITVAAFAFSEKAKKKIIAAKGKWLSLFELVAQNPEGSKVKIIG
jgi:large subunit ribosomal protein L18e